PVVLVAGVGAAVVLGAGVAVLHDAGDAGHCRQAGARAAGEQQRQGEGTDSWETRVHGHAPWSWKGKERDTASLRVIAQRWSAGGQGNRRGFSWLVEEGFRSSRLAWSAATARGIVSLGRARRPCASNRVAVPPRTCRSRRCAHTMRPAPVHIQMQRKVRAYTSRMAKLYFYYSAMNAGKTTTLLQSAHNYRERGMRVAILSPRLDDRAGTGRVASRIGLSADAAGFGADDDLLAWAYADIAAHGRLDCLLVDEAQFLRTPQVWQLSEIVDRLRVPVLCYGLRTDFRGELFEGSQYLMAWADEISEIKTICHSGSKATMTVRVDDRGRAVQAGPQVEIGGNERYVSVS